MDKGPRILFMGTPKFAVASLGALLMNGYNVVGVVTSPDKPAGRGRKISRSAVADYAISNYLNLLQPTNLKDESFIKGIEELKPDISVVVAFRMLPEEVWSIPVLGTFNLHASLLPQYRGAAPINHAIINGEKSTGITTFLIDKKIDTGSILFRRSLKISYSENAGELHDRLMRSGAKLVVKTVKALYSKKAKTINQNNLFENIIELKPAPKIFSKDCYISWDSSTEEIHNFVRGLSPYPGARTELLVGTRKLLVKILEGKPICGSAGIKAGNLITSTPHKISISTRDGQYELSTIQVEGKKAMKVEDYLRGVDPDSISIATSLQA
jgi:methionyl-tRNA formyltransferase